MPDNTPTAPPPGAPPPAALPDGTRLEYALGDSGMDLPDIGIYLAPDVVGVVGEDLSGDLARRLVDRGTLRVQEAPGPAPKA